jgi:hypothetical protein
VIHERAEDGRGWAIFSDCRRYRYALGRSWQSTLLGEDNKVLLVCGLNPSTAGANEPDVTITKEVGFATRHGCTSLVKVNLYDLISTDPKGLTSEPWGKLEGPERAAALDVAWEYWSDCFARMTLLAWGAHPLATAPRINSMLRELPGPYWCLGTTANGQPRHTSRLAYATPLELWKGAP